jgi:hypothetical protein
MGLADELELEGFKQALFSCLLHFVQMMISL